MVSTLSIYIEPPGGGGGGECLYSHNWYPGGEGGERSVFILNVVVKRRFNFPFPGIGRGRDMLAREARKPT